MSEVQRIAVIGGGAAGFFSAIVAAECHPKAEVVLLEKSDKLLAKVRISGGGRCNVTNGTTSIAELAKGYPRGGKALKKVFGKWNTQHTMQWFESRGVPLKTEADGRVFPTSDDSASIVQCLFSAASAAGVIVRTHTAVVELESYFSRWLLHIRGEGTLDADRVIVATGGSPKRHGLEWLEDLGHEVIDPVPSLFTFNTPGSPLAELMGLSVNHGRVAVEGSTLAAEGPVLITHWGLSGPAVLKCSAFGARELADLGYRFTVRVNWMGEKNQDVIRQSLAEIAEAHGKKHLRNHRPEGIPERLWHFLLEKEGIDAAKPWMELGKKGLNRLTHRLAEDDYAVQGKTTFKEEFVTCGGVSLNAVDHRTFQSRTCPGVYFAGEVLDIDGITGGYNFQAAWTTGFIAGQLMA